MTTDESNKVDDFLDALYPDSIGVAIASLVFLHFILKDPFATIVLALSAVLTVILSYRLKPGWQRITCRLFAIFLILWSIARLAVYIGLFSVPIR